MINVVAYKIVPAIFVGTVLYLAYFLYQMNTMDGVVLKKRDIERQIVQNRDINDSANPWLSYFAATDKRDYFFPATEIIIEANLNREVLDVKEYRLDVPALDPYEFFCLKQVLTQFRVKYFLKRRDSKVEVMLYSTDLVQLNNIIDALAIYEIHAKVVEVKKDNNESIS
jgi:hypothetical protein